MLFWTFTAGVLCGVLVGVPLGFMLRYTLYLYELPRADPLSAVDDAYGAKVVFVRDGGTAAADNVTYWQRARTIGANHTGDNGRG